MSAEGQKTPLTALAKKPAKWLIACSAKELRLALL